MANWVRTKYDPRVDQNVDSTSNSPRVKFSYEYMKKYIKDARQVLDIGCGTGSYIRALDKNGVNIGIDLEIDALKIAKNYINSNFLKASVLNLPFQDKTLDVITMWEVIEHLPVGTEHIAISEVKRVLTDNGIFILSTPNKHVISNMMDPAYFLRGHRHYNAKNLMKLITDMGFSVLNYEVKGGIASLIAMNLFYINKHIFHRKNDFLQRFFDECSKKEYSLGKNGFSNLFIIAKNNETK
jgi:2-polyprenyl-3-methyl-5-hydroxy-6-metoxy-1,4-benzoquinol methylase